MPTETRWTKGWPKNGDYWRRADENDTPQLVRIRGAAYRLLEKGTHGLRGEHVNSRLAATPRDPDTFEYLGPVSPSDFEQLAALRKAASDALEWIETSLGCDDIAADGSAVLITLRKALGEK